MFAVVGFAALTAIGSAYYANHKWYNHEVALFDTKSGHTIRVWSTWYWPGRDQRMLQYEVFHNGKLVIPPSDLETGFDEKTDRVDILSSQNGNEIAIITEYGNRILLIGDLTNNRFISCFGFVKRGLGSETNNWSLIEHNIRKEHPNLSPTNNWVTQ